MQSYRDLRIRLLRHTETHMEPDPARGTVTADPRLGKGTREFGNLREIRVVGRRTIPPHIPAGFLLP